MKTKIALLICAVSLLVYPMAVRADAVSATIYQVPSSDTNYTSSGGLYSVNALITLATALAADPAVASAQFTTNALNYNSNGSTDYTPNTFLGSPTFTNIVGSFDPNASLNNTYMLFTGNLYLQSGMNTFSITHDDGIELSIGTIYDSLGTYAGPTSAETTTFNITPPSPGLYSFELAYIESNGPPAVLESNMPVAVPEPASAIVLTLGSLAMAAYGWRRRKTVEPVTV